MFGNLTAVLVDIGFCYACSQLGVVSKHFQEFVCVKFHGQRIGGIKSVVDFLRQIGRAFVADVDGAEKIELLAVLPCDLVEQRRGRLGRRFLRQILAGDLAVKLGCAQTEDGGFICNHGSWRAVVGVCTDKLPREGGGQIVVLLQGNGSGEVQRGIVLGLAAQEAAVVIEIAAIFGFQCVSCGGIKGAFDQPAVARVGYGCVRQQRGRAEVCGQIVRHQLVKISIVRKITLCGFAV